MDLLFIIMCALKCHVYVCVYIYGNFKITVELQNYGSPQYYTKLHSTILWWYLLTSSALVN